MFLVLKDNTEVFRCNDETIARTFAMEYVNGLQVKGITGQVSIVHEVTVIPIPTSIRRASAVHLHNIEPNKPATSQGTVTETEHST